MAKSISHKKDIKVLCPIRNLSAAMTIYGFESYTRVTNSAGVPVKSTVANVPLQFMPGVDEAEEGYTVSYVSDTTANRKLLKELMDAGTVICDSPIFEMREQTEAEKLPVDISVQDEHEASNLGSKKKAELLSLAAEMGLQLDMTATKDQIIAAITGAE